MLDFVRYLPLSLALACFVGCADDPVATSSFGTGGGDGGDAGSGTTGSESADETGDDPTYTPDPIACTPHTCVDAADCCVGAQPALPGACPSADWPNNWTCSSGTCVHGGCSANADCIVPDFDCVNLGTVSQCVAVCEDDDDCTEAEDDNDNDLSHAMPGTECIGTAAGGVQYCLQPLP